MSTPRARPSRTKKKSKELVFDSLVPRKGADFAYFTERAEQLTLRTIAESGAADYILARPNHPFFMRMLEYMTDRAYGKVPQEVKNRLEVMPAVALPEKAPEHIPDGQYEVMPEAALAAGSAVLLPPKTDGSTDHLEAPAWAADDVPHRE